jgi:hypothetical protein
MKVVARKFGATGAPPALPPLSGVRVELADAIRALTGAHVAVVGGLEIYRAAGYDPRTSTSAMRPC